MNADLEHTCKYRALDLHTELADDAITYDTFLMLQSTGCSCCTEHIPITSETLALAIADTEQFLSKLKQLQQTLQ